MSGSVNSRVQLPLPLALLLENCRTSGLPDELIVACIREQQFAALAERPLADSKMELAERARLAQELGTDWEAVLRNGYEFGFLHLNGLKRLLAFRYGLREGTDYAADEDRLERVPLAPEQAAELAALIHRQWLVQPQSAQQPTAPEPSASGNTALPEAAASTTGEVDPHQSQSLSATAGSDGRMEVWSIRLKLNSGPDEASLRGRTE